MKEDSFALVTGASRGLGMAFARELAARHHNLVLVARSAEPLQAFASELRGSHPVSVIALPADLASPGAGQNLAERLSHGGIQIDLLVNNAGFGLRGEFRDLSLLRQLEMLRLNNQAIVELTYSLLPGMLGRAQKGIINVSSTAGFQPIPFASAYSATKAFLTTFSLALEQELRHSGVTVVTICPGRLRVAPEDAENSGERKKVPGGEQAHEDVVNEAMRALERGGGLVIPGAVNKFAAFAERFIPRSQVARLIKKISSPPS